jgi:aromatic-L-amino-acid decarboxylase
MPAANCPVSTILQEVGRLIAYVIEGRTQEPPLADGLDHHSVATLFDEEVPTAGIPAEEVILLIAERVIPASLNLSNPFTFGLMTPPPLPLPAALDGLISALNQNLGCAWRTAPSGIHVELQTLRWLCQLCGLPENSGGQFTTGGTISNLTALRLALHRAFPEARAKGLAGIKHPVVVYVSDQGHFSIDRAAGILGMGENRVRKIPSTSDLRMDVGRLEEQIRTDRATGHVPIAVVGTAGTTATGSIDPLAGIAEICGRENLWFPSTAHMEQP